jgi:glucosamine--fructose-6-phosphate aminotransferase (isomerizing)
VERTLLNRWKIADSGDGPHYAIHLDERTFPRSLEAAFAEDRIRRVFFVGQGTAGVAAQACADILNYPTWPIPPSSCAPSRPRN